MANRTIPFGYHMVDGNILAHPEESAVVQSIYQRYAQGDSYLTIAQCLTKEGTPYAVGKADWNKNMVARILQNTRYQGTEKYPAIVTKEQCVEVQSAAKPYTHTEPQAIKDLKPKLVCAHCGAGLKRRTKAKSGERWICPQDKDHIAQDLTDHSLLRQARAMEQQASMLDLEVSQSNAISIEVIRLQREIDTLLEEAELQMESIKEKILQLANLKYDLCPQVHHTQTIVTLSVAGDAIVKAKTASGQEVKRPLSDIPIQRGIPCK